METWSVHHLYKEAEAKLGQEKAASIIRYAQTLIDNGLPVIFSLKHLAKITETSPKFLIDTVKGKREATNYRMFSIRKRDGRRRFIHAVSRDLYSVQRFINLEILQKIKPHPSSYAFHASGGIYECAYRHCEAKWLFQFDLKDFFYTISEISVYNLFHELGYTKILSYELAKLCTTTRIPKNHTSVFSKRVINSDKIFPYPIKNGKRILGVLPQGAPSSPMISNLVARPLDLGLNSVAKKYGFTYTRYADDICISATSLPPDISIGRIYKEILDCIRKSGFIENKKKIRIAGPGSKKIVLGLLVDREKPKLSKETRHRIDRLVHALVKFGVKSVANNEHFDSAFGFQNHFHGLISFVKSIDSIYWEKINNRLAPVKWLSLDVE